MNLEISQISLAKSLNLVSRAVGLKPSLPVLSNVLLSLEKGQLRLLSTNLETSITSVVAVKGDEDGAITVPARLLAEFINSLPPETVTLTTKDEGLFVKSGKFEADFAGISASEFPKIPAAKDEDKIFLDKDFARALSQTSFAASSDEGRPVLTGLLMEFKPQSLSLVATDGYRLAKKTLKTGAELTTTLLLPAKALSEVGRLMGETDDTSEISMQPLTSQNQVIFTLGPTQVTTRVLDGTYPPYQSIIPETFRTRVVVEAEQFSQAVKSTSLFARDLGNVVHIQIDPEKGSLVLSANTAQVGTGRSQLEASVEGEKCKVAFNSHYLTGGLGVLGNKQISIEANEGNKAVLLRPIGDDSFIYILMPVRLQGNDT